VVVATGHATVGRDHEHRRHLAVFAFTKHRVVQVCRGHETLHHVLHLVGVRLRRLNALLGFGDARCRDQLLGLGDFLRGID